MVARVHCSLCRGDVEFEVLGAAMAPQVRRPPAFDKGPADACRGTLHADRYPSASQAPSHPAIQSPRVRYLLLGRHAQGERYLYPPWLGSPVPYPCPLSQNGRQWCSADNPTAGGGVPVPPNYAASRAQRR